MRSKYIHPDDPETVVIPLTQGKVAFVSRVDAHLGDFAWAAIRQKSGWYAVRSVGPRGRQKLISMHRVIMGAGLGQRIDHRDRDGLNNRRSNLRHATVSQNNSNSYRPPSASGFRGVVAMGKRWRAQIRKNHERIYLGFYDTPEDAARAYDTAARAFHGEFAMLNFPSGV